MPRGGARVSGVCGPAAASCQPAPVCRSAPRAKFTGRPVGAGAFAGAAGMPRGSAPPKISLARFTRRKASVANPSWFLSGCTSRDNAR